MTQLTNAIWDVQDMQTGANETSNSVEDINFIEPVKYASNIVEQYLLINYTELYSNIPGIIGTFNVESIENLEQEQPYDQMYIQSIADGFVIDIGTTYQVNTHVCTYDNDFGITNQNHFEFDVQQGYLLNTDKTYQAFKHDHSNTVRSVVGYDVISKQKQKPNYNWG